MLTMSDHNVMMNQFQATHAPDGREVDVKPLLHLIEDILNRATIPVDTTMMDTEAQAESIEDTTHQANFVAILEELTYMIDRISCKIAYKVLGGSDAHAITLSIVTMLSSYSWDAKLALTLAAFALNYGEFWLLAQIYSTNQLAKSIAILRQLPMIMDHSGPLKPRFKALNNLIRVMMDVTRIVVEELSHMHISQDEAEWSTAMADIPTAVYWTIRSVVACTTQITSLSGMGHEYAVSTTEAWELLLKNIHEHLKEQLAICEEYRVLSIESSLILIDQFEIIHIDNMKVLKAIIYARDDIQPLIDGSTKRSATLDILRRKNVLLLISGLKSHDELSILKEIYNESRLQATGLDSQYEVVWIPIVDRWIQWTHSMQKQFESLQATMPWYSVHHPTIIDNSAIKFIKEKWHFRNKPILVVLDPQGRVVSPNAIHMMWIWGSNAFPFTTLREDALWEDVTWSLEFLVNGIDPMILNWIKEEKYILLYGGDDAAWVRKFTNQARALATSTCTPLEMVYIGNSSKSVQVKRVIETITAENLSYCWQDLTMMWFFWTRLESMLFSKIQLGMAEDHDPMMQEIKKFLSYDKEGGWSVLSKGSQVMDKGQATTILPGLMEYESSKNVEQKLEFISSLKGYQDRKFHSARPSCRFESPNTARRIPKNMKCPECQRLIYIYGEIRHNPLPQ